MSPLRILFVTPYVPSLLRTRPYGFVTQLAQRGHRLTLLCAVTSAHDLEAAAALRPLCERLELVPVSTLQSVRNCLRGAASGVPLQALYCHAPALRARLAGLLAGDGQQGYDVAHIEHLRAALLGLQMRGVPRLFDAVDCITELFELTQHHGGTWLSRMTAAVDLPRTRRFERRLTRIFEGVIVTSAAEAAALGRLHDDESSPRRIVCVVPNGVDLHYFAPPSGPRHPATLLYVGRMSYHANVSAVLGLMQTVMPIVWKSRPETQVVICGADPTRAIRRLPQRYGTRVTVTGTVADVRPYLQRATISVSPLRYAAGIQNKVLEAMASGTPVVASTAACAGLSARRGDEVLLADDSDGFAAHIVQLLADTALQRRVGAAARRYVEEHHDWSQVAQRLEQTYQDAISSFHRERTTAD